MQETRIRRRFTVPGFTGPSRGLADPFGWVLPVTSWQPGYAVAGPMVAAALAFLVIHLLTLAPAPATVDGTNLVLGARDFDIADHRPHPPGYPVFVALGKVSRLVLPSNASEPTARLAHDTRGLAIWSALLGSLAVWPLWRIFRYAGGSVRGAAAASLLVLTVPMYWLLSGLPLSDAAGLSSALLIQALWLRSLAPRDSSPAAPSRRLVDSEQTVVLGAFLSGLIIGIRFQTVWLTLPLLGLAGVRTTRRRAARAGLAAAFACGVLVWAGPLLVASGGAGEFLRASRAQAAEHWRDDRLLATSPSFDHLKAVLVATFVFPWGSDFLGVTAIVLACIGAIGTVRREPRAARLLALLYGPYLVFHLLLQDSNHVRYAIPLVPAVAFLAVQGVDLMARRAMPWIVAAMGLWCLATALPPAVGYAREGNPVFRAVHDIEARSAETDARGRPRPILAMHHSVSRLLRAEPSSLTTLPSIPDYEWLELVNYWRSGGRAPIWFLAEPHRTDLALVDPTSRRLVRAYTWPFHNPRLTTQPPGLLWYELDPPGWMAGRGWSLTPETGGVTAADGRGPGRRPIYAYVRRRAEPVQVLLGGWNLGADGDPTVRLEARVDGVEIESWRAGWGPFLRSWSIRTDNPGGAGAYATLEITATPAIRDGRQPQVVIDQFDAQSRGSLLYGYGRGWHREAFDEAGTRWRWTDRTAELDVYPPDEDLVLTLVAEHPLDEGSGPPQVVVRSGADLLTGAVEASRGRFTLEVPIPRGTLERPRGILTIELDRAYAVRVMRADPDRPHTGLRVFSLTLRPRAGIAGQ